MAKKKTVHKEPGAHIRKSTDGQIFVLSIGNNSESLQQSETLEMKASAIVNIAAMVRLFSDPNLMVIDETGAKSRKIKFSELIKKG